MKAGDLMGHEVSESVDCGICDASVSEPDECIWLQSYARLACAPWGSRAILAAFCTVQPAEHVLVTLSLACRTIRPAFTVHHQLKQ